MAYINLNPTLKNARSNAIVAGVGSGGNLLIYTGSPPSDPSVGPGGTLLATLPLSSPCGVSSGGVLNLSAVTTANASATGTAGWARMATSGGTGQVDLDCGVTGSGASLQLNSTSLTSGSAVSVTSGTITEA